MKERILPDYHKFRNFLPILPDSVQLPFEEETTGSNQQFMTGNAMSIVGGVEDETVKETYWIKNSQVFTFGTGEEGQTTITITTAITQWIMVPFLEKD